MTPAEVRSRADALISEGHAREDGGDVAGALERYRAAIVVAPSYPRAHLNAGNALLAMGDTAAAVAAYREALRLDATYAPAHYSLGRAHSQAGRVREAIDCHRQAVACNPEFADAWIALGNTQDDLAEWNDALESYRRAAQLRPGFAPVLVNIAGVQHRLGLLDLAESTCRSALALDPASPEGHACLGKILLDRGDETRALISLRRGSTSDAAMLAHAYHCANQLCDWTQRQRDEQQLVQLVEDGRVALAPFYLLNVPPSSGMTPQLQKRAAEKFAQQFAPVFEGAYRSWQRRDPKRLRIGLLSADFHEHATMHLLRGVLQAHDSERFTIIGYSYGERRDAMTEVARASCDEFRDVASLADADAAEAIFDDGVDVLVDLKGFTRGSRLGIVARRPAPVLVSWLGYPGTLGDARLADWIVGDRIVSPVEHAHDFSESLALMPDCYQPNDRDKAIGAPVKRQDAGLPGDAFVFCSFNQPYKISPETFDVWCRLLESVPRSVLWLLAGSQAMQDNLRREASARGVQPGRLVFAPPLPLDAHLARLSLADIALDTFPYNSHTTGSDALWAGVPLVTCMGPAFASRVAASLLHATGLPELVTTDWAAYFELARSLATDPAKLSGVRAKLAVQREALPLFDTARFTRNLESLLDRIWQSHARGDQRAIKP